MIILGEYKVGKTIGEGAFSKVKAAVHIPSGVKVAIKIIYKESMNQSKKSIEEEFNDCLSDQPTRKGVYGGDSITNSAKTFLSTMEKEVKLLMRLNHPNIIKTYQFIDGEKESFVVMQLAMGEMADFMITKGKLSDKEGRKYFRQLISGIDYIHKANVVHRDLKLENLLLDENHNLLISDFGLGRVISRDSNQLLDTFCGTPNYAAAELISAIPYLGTKSDIWAMGVILYFFMAGTTPFKGRDLHNLYENIRAANYVVPKKFSESLTDIISKILVPNPEKRIDMEQIRSHPWVNKNEISMPEVIEPDSSGIVTDNDLGKIISSINNDKKHVVYTFNQVKNSKMDPVFALHREGSVKEDKLTVIGVTTRKRSQTVTKGTGGQIVIMTTSSSGKNLTDEVTKNLKQSFPTDESLDQFPTGNTSLFVAPVKGRQRAKSNVVGRSKTTAVFPSLKNIIPETKDSSLGLEATNIVTSPSQSSILASNEKFKRADSILRRMSSVIQSEETTDALKIDVGEINEWHNVHKPPKTIRSSKFMFNSRGSSARLEPATMFQDIHRALMTMQATLPEVQLTFRRVDEYYMFDSKAKDSKGCLMEFTVELCQVWLLNLHAMKIRRTSGDTFLFKDMHDTLLNLIDWKK